MAAGIKVGEAFVDVGLDLKPEKLKEADDLIRSSLSGLMKLAGVTAGVGGFLTLMNHAGDTAVALRNLNSEFGYSTKGAQEWIAVMRQADPLLGEGGAMASYRHIAEYLREIRMGRTSAVAMNQLGVQVNPNMTPDDVINQVSSSLPKLLSSGRITRDMASQWVSQIFGTGTAINALMMSPEERARIGATGIVDEKAQQALVDYKTTMAELNIQFDRMTATMLQVPAEKLTDLFKAALGTDSEKQGFLAGVGRMTDWIGENSPLGKADQLLQGTWQFMKELAPVVSRGIQNSNIIGTQSTESMEFWINRGYSRQAAAGMVANERKESGFNPAARGDGGHAVGIMQWHPDRVKAILAATGIDVRSADHYQQLRAAAWELEHSGVGAALRGVKTPEEAGALISRRFLRPGLTEEARTQEAHDRAAMAAQEYKNLGRPNMSNTFIIHGKDPKAIADHVDNTLQKQYSVAYSQTNTGGRY